jgi:uncharacterized protein
MTRTTSAWKTRPTLTNRERRVERSRRTVELVLDTFFRPWDWAARTAYTLGLQGRVRTTTTTVDLLGGLDVPPLRIAFASDFHAGATTSHKLLEHACEQLADLEPDLVLLGGDFVSVRASYAERLVPHLDRIEAPLGKFAVLGNHDLRANSGEIVSSIARAGVRMLTNARVSLPPPFDGIDICGLDDPGRGAPRADLALDGAAPIRVVLMHSPDGLRFIGDRPFTLALCGHTHGGQVVLPWGTPLFIPGGGLSRRYRAGQFAVGRDARSTLIVSHGIGCSTIPVRIFAAPQVHLCLIV